MQKKIALITGASRGLGRALAVQLATQHIETIIVARDTTQLHETQNAVSAVGGTAHIYCCDLSHSEQRQKLINDIQQNFATLDIVIHNAATLVSGPLTQISPTAITESITTNIVAAIELSRGFFDNVSKTKGVIAFIGSTTSHVPMPYNTIYTTTKFAVHGFAKTLHYEAKQRGIHIFTTYPPAMYTQMTQNMATAMELKPQNFYPCDKAARKIVCAILKHKMHLNFYTPEYILSVLYKFFPRITTKILEFNRHKFATAMKENIK